jgi:hypothetical protein
MVQLDERSEAYHKVEHIQKDLLDEQHRMRERWYKSLAHL